jgi:general secretion pathway protein A
MYTAFYGLKENPFTLSPNPDYLFMSPQHEEAINHLVYGINERKGFIVITGDVGTGKTTVCRYLLANVDQSIETAWIFNPALSDIELLGTINQEFGLDVTGEQRSKKKYIDELNKYLLNNLSSGKNAVILIDEAQNLSHNTMEQIRLLSNLETVREKIVQIVLVGQPKLRSLLTMPSLKQLNNRITVRYELSSLDQENVEKYIRHRLTVAGGENVMFSLGAYKMIYAYSKGNPRYINAICDRALLIAYTEEVFGVSNNIIRNAVRDIGHDYFAGKYYIDKRWFDSLRYFHL